MVFRPACIAILKRGHRHFEFPKFLQSGRFLRSFFSDPRSHGICHVCTDPKNEPFR